MPPTLQGVKDELVAILMTEAKGMTSRQLFGNFRELVGETLNHQLFGFSSLDSFLKSLSDIIRVSRNADGETVYMCIPTEESEHIAAMKRREKTKKARRGKPARQRNRTSVGGGWISSRGGVSARRTVIQPPRFNSNLGRSSSTPSSSFNQSGKNIPPLLNLPKPEPLVPLKSSESSLFSKSSSVPKDLRSLISPRQVVVNQPSGSSNERPPRLSKPAMKFAVEKTVQKPFTVTKAGNAKLLLQEYVNKNRLSPLVFRHTQTYRHVQTYNGINNVVGYVCSVTVRGDIYGSIEICRTKSEAETLAAENACKALKLIRADGSLANLNEKDASSANVSRSGSSIVEIQAAVREVLSGHHGGLLSNQLENEVKMKFPNLVLPANLVSLVEGWSFIETTSIPGRTWKIFCIRMEPETDVHMRKISDIKKDEKIDNLTEFLTLPESNEWNVYVCCINSSIDVVVRLAGEGYSDELEKLEQSMSALEHSPRGNVSVNMLCALRSESQSPVGDIVEWYRVRLTSIEFNKQALVTFVDHGGTDVVPLSSLCPLPDKYCRLPFQAIFCKLTGLESYARNMFITNMLFDRAVGKTLVAEVDDRMGKVSLTLWDTSLAEDVNINKEVSQVLQDSELQPMLPKVGETVEVLISFVTSDGDIYIQIVGPGVLRLRQVMEELEQTYSKRVTDTSLFVKQPLIGRLYIVQVGSEWYRAKVCRHFEQSKEVEVFFVDYGDTTIVSLAVLREVSPELRYLFEFPGQTLRCRLADPLNWNAEMSAKLMDLAPSSAPRVLEVVLYDNEVALVDIFEVSRDGELMSMVDVLYKELDDSDSVLPSDVDKGQLFQQLTDFLDTKAKSSVVESGDKTKNLLSYLNPTLPTTYSQLPSNLTPAFPQLVVPNQPSLILPQLVTQNQSSSSFTSVLPEFTIPFAAHADVDITSPFSSFSPIQLQSSLDMTQLAKQLVDVQQSPVGSSVISPGLNSRVMTPVTSVKELDKSSQGFEKLTSGDRVYVSWVVDPSHMVLIKMINKSMLQKLHEAMAQLASSPPLNQNEVSIGDVVAAYVAEEKLWFRAKVQQKYADQVKVFLCDYCDHELLSFHQLRALPSQFLKLPFQGIRASLASVKPVDVEWSNAAILWMRARVEGKEMQVWLMSSGDEASGDKQAIDNMISVLLIETDTSGTTTRYIHRDLVDAGHAIIGK